MDTKETHFEAGGMMRQERTWALNILNGKARINSLFSIRNECNDYFWICAGTTVAQTLAAESLPVSIAPKKRQLLKKQSW